MADRGPGKAKRQMQKERCQADTQRDGQKERHIHRTDKAKDGTQAVTCRSRQDADADADGRQAIIRQTDGQTHRQADKQASNQSDGQTGASASRQARRTQTDWLAVKQAGWLAGSLAETAACLCLLGACCLDPLCLYPILT